ncbi:hypothetical protein [Parafilimonas sp.]|uniref:hypothetical protein n=1 Tax=Parafilimonas sp. TaxID=1969739 RepID=UPI0039E5FE42
MKLLPGIQYKALRRLKAAVWLYFLLVIFEGALRKWVLPGLSDPLLIIRDPIAVYIILAARAKGLYAFNPYSFWMVLVTCIAMVTAVTMGHGNVFVALFGARVFLIHFPLMFAIGRILDADDLVQIGRVTLGIAIPATLLIIMQFYSPQSAFVNRGVGGDAGGAGFSGALGYYRPPGFFSFTNGNSLYYGFLAACIFYFWFHAYLINRLLLITATVCLLLAIPFSISRTLLFEIALSLSFMIIALLRKPGYVKRIAAGAALVGAAWILLKDMRFFGEGMNVFIARFESANETEGGLHGVFFDRFAGGMISALQNAPNIPFFGYGIGMGTNAGAVLLSGDRQFLIAEEEWGRIIGELGLLPGFIIIFIRVSLSISLLKRCIKELRKGNTLPWMLFSFAFINIWQGNWAQPTSLGFAMLAGGMILAAFNDSLPEEVTLFESADEETACMPVIEA